MLTFTLTSAKPLKWIKSLVSTPGPLTRFPFFFSLFVLNCRKRYTSRGSEKAHETDKRRNRENALSVFSGNVSKLGQFLQSAETHLLVLTEGGDVLQCCSATKDKEQVMLLGKREEADRKKGVFEGWTIPTLCSPSPTDGS